LEFNENAYSLIISETVQEQLRGIKDYISANYFSEQAGANTVKNILYGLERLEVFPEAGFDADERVGGIIYPPHKTSMHHFRRLPSLLSYFRGQKSCLCIRYYS